MPEAFKQRDNEPVLLPVAFDKFYSREIQPLQRLWSDADSVKQEPLAVETDVVFDP
ncbi:MAG: hypothetical protein QF619_05255 [Candidatus Binatia bacterium]|jgi:hypothetical protein|nr:hypothetical protein [Candidatus Binatia bacterium]